MEQGLAAGAESPQEHDVGFVLSSDASLQQESSKILSQGAPFLNSSPAAFSLKIIDSNSVCRAVRKCHRFHRRGLSAFRRDGECGFFCIFRRYSRLRFLFVVDLLSLRSCMPTLSLKTELFPIESTMVTTFWFPATHSMPFHRRPAISFDALQPVSRFHGIPTTRH